jgi:hydroxymethylglutaryl-CoA synthase
MACVSSSWAIISGWEHVMINPNKMVIIVNTDEAKYALESRAEPTQGTGSLAILMKANPSLVELYCKYNQVGCSVVDTYEYYRPPGIEFPIINGDLTEKTFIARIKEAYQDYVEKTGEDRILSELKAINLHTPFPGMVGKTIGYLLAHLEEEKIKEFCSVIGLELGKEPEDIFQKKFRASTFFQKFYLERVEPGLRACSQTGNLYTAALPLSLMSFLTYGNLKKDDLVGFGGFGSGSEALVYKGRCVDPRKNFNLKEKLANREPLDFGEYEKWRRKVSRFLEMSRRKIKKDQEKKLEKREI